MGMQRRAFPLVVALLLSLLPQLRGATWLHASSEHFEVLSEVSQGDTQEFLIQIEQLRVVFGDLFHKFPPQDIKTPILYCRINDHYRSYLYKSGRDSYYYVSGGVYFGPKPFPYIVTGRFQEERNSKTAITESYINLLFSSFPTQVPDWYRLGFIECFTTLQYSDHEYQFGQHNGYRIAELVDKGSVPLRKLLCGISLSSYQVSQVISTSWMFVHFCLFGRPELLEQKLTNYLDLLASQPDESRETLFKQAFGVSFEEMDQALAKYLVGSKYKFRKSKLPKKDSISVVFDKYSAAECDAFRTIGKTERDLNCDDVVSGDNLAAAVRPLLAGNNEFLLTWAGEVSFAAKESSLARECAERVISLNTQNVRMYSLAINIELEQRVTPSEWNIQLQPELSQKLRDLVDHALAIDPFNPVALSQLATIEAMSRSIRYDKINLVQRSLSQLAIKDRILCMLALVRFRENDFETVKQIAASGLIRSNPERAILNRILAAANEEQPSAKSAKAN